MPPNLINATMKTAIIVGATSGIGREVAITLVLEGWNVGLAGRRIDLLNKLRDQYGRERVHVAAIDVSSSEACGALDALFGQNGQNHHKPDECQREYYILNQRNSINNALVFGYGLERAKPAAIGWLSRFS